MNKPDHLYIAAVFENPDQVQTMMEDMNRHNFLMDQISLLHRTGGRSDDFLGISYSDEKERFKIWGTHGALWDTLTNLVLFYTRHRSGNTGVTDKIDLLMHCNDGTPEHWRQQVTWEGADPVFIIA
ncbi:MAG: hypothetical protein GXP11_00365 [Gammaproteobacteria bacterium]|nr:hypothetical protein [Gammaproteobacteria bacterium]